MNKMLYNEKLKEQFIHQYSDNDNSKKVLRSFFNSVSKIETDFEKDLSNFSADDLVSLFSLIPSRTIKSIIFKQAIIKDYINWVMKKTQDSNITINPAIMYEKKDLQRFVSKTAQQFQYIKNRDAMYKFCDMLNNERDAALFALIYEGVRGRSNIEDSFEEICNLRTEHVHQFTNRITAVRNDGEVREVDVDSRTMELVMDAIEQKEYHDGNGEHPKGKISELMDTDYVIKGIKTIRQTEQPQRTLITSIFKIIKKYTGMPFLTPIKVFESGMLATCAELEKEKGELQETDYKDVVLKYGQNHTIWYGLKEKYLMFKEMTDKK